MKTMLVAAVAALSLTAGSAEARGCLKGAVGGAGAGGRVGHHRAHRAYRR